MVRALFPGTFDPIHYGHMDIANRASKLFDEVVMAVYDKPLKNLMFSPDERMALVREAFNDNPKIKVTGYSGLTIEFAQKINAHVIVRGLRVFSDFEFEFRMALANQRLAGAAVETIAFITAEQHTFLSSSTVREIATLNGNVSSMVPSYVEHALKEKVAQLGEQSLPNALRD
ncbi:MAG: pantetheine-phosphate adenylyltransferase [Anaerolineales bacterium]|jgi:pantetheine-phosphate adenylyltransferase|uniref:pantetheine-phosphate adenylyltransferase n=1 Tax=Candidatus Villigracilis vicinus TaxID=3140679 RepID=UPI0031349C79|nr:pantetheine-phosphate adenylyltransferase [Anaerolineales bacterium]MBK7449688.1 pantetheine-phosphate adenylyltransferase [Anaerolineales bacterium]MBK9782068.1 pantetheine-phosphate adenylyltransferase [Anaerolineales bacterium]